MRRRIPGLIRWSAAAAAGGLLAGAIVVLAAAPASACGDATVVQGNYEFITNYQTPDPAPTDVVFEATAVGGDGSWSAWTRGTALPDPIQGTFSLGCLDAGTMYEFWFDVDGGDGHSYLFHVGTEYPNAFQHETELFPVNPGWFTLDMRSPSVLTAVLAPSAPSGVLRVPTNGSAPLVIAPTTGLDRPVQLPSTSLGTATVPGRDVVIAAHGTQITLFPGTVVTGPPAWDGRVVLPTRVSLETVPDGAEAVVAVRVGTASGGLAFSRPVRVVLLDQGGKSAGFVAPGGAFTPIERECASNDEAGLGTANECVIRDGDDLVIWTTHFTVFAAYASATVLATTGPQDVLPAIGWGAAALAVGGAALLIVGRSRFATLVRDGRPQS